MEQNIKNIFSDFAIQMENDVKYDKYSEKDLINKWTSVFLTLSEKSQKETAQLSFKQLYLDTMLAVCNKTQKNVLFECIPTGLTALDRIIGGLPLGELIILGARPAMGKTALLLSIMAHSICNQNEPIAYFTLENTAQSIMLRLLSLFSEQNLRNIVSKGLEPYQVQALQESTQKLSEGSITIVDQCFCIDDIITRTHFLIKEKGVKMIIVDYMQLIQCKGKLNREQDIAKICRELKTLSKKYNIAVLVSSQLSRAVESRGGDKRPQLADLRESGAIEQDADKVLFLYRPEYYNITEDYEGNSTIGIAEIIVAKNREGAVDSAKVKFVGNRGVFKDLDLDTFSTRTITTVPSYNLDAFKNIRQDEFHTGINPLVLGSKMNDIEEDHPF